MNRTEGEPVLSCWKDIAQYLGKGVRTVQRWERDFGLPVRRLGGATHKSAVVANSRDIDAWLRQRWSRRKAPGVPARPPAYTSGLSALRDSIASGHALRRSHDRLVQEFAVSLQMLVDNCERIAKQMPNSLESNGTVSNPATVPVSLSHGPFPAQAPSQVRAA